MSTDYFLIFLLIITLIIFYGGQNKINRIIYDNDYFYFINNLEIFNSILKDDRFLNNISPSKNLFNLEKENLEENVEKEFNINSNVNFVYDIDENIPCLKGLFPNLSNFFFNKFNAK